LVPPEVAYFRDTLQILILSDNALSGRLPDAIGQLSMLEDFYMDRNLFVGELPSTIGGLQRLRRWYLERNPNLSGTFPPAVAELTNLQALVLYYTMITDLTNDICIRRESRDLAVLIFDCRQIVTNTCWSRCFYLCGGSTGIPCSESQSLGGGGGFR